MMKNSFLFILAFLLIISCTQEEQPKEPDPVRRKSPIAISSITHKPSNTYIKIVYGQPYKNGRVIFGDLVPYGEVWRTGANEATEMTTTKSIRFNGSNLDAGTYALFSIPGADEWTIILNDSLGQWGAFDYNQEYDRLRTTVEAKKTEQPAEAFTIKFKEIIEDSTTIIMQWDTTKVEIPITFTEQAAGPTGL